VDGSITTFTGTYSISTPLGTVSGTAVGSLATATAPVIFHLVLTPTATSGAFAGMAGSLVTDIKWGGYPATTIAGTVTAPPAT
jgi:hypothetical protein